MKFNNILLLSLLILSSQSFASTKVGTGGVFSINRSIESLTVEHKTNNIRTLDISELAFENGDVVEVETLANKFISSIEVRNLKAQGVSGFILKDGKCILIDDIISDDGDDDGFIATIKRGGEGGGE